MSRLKNAFKATAVGQIFGIMAILLSLFAVPLYLHWLGQERYGLLLTGMALGTYLMFADAGLTWASMLLIAEASGRDDRVEMASIVRNCLSLVCCSIMLVVILTGCFLAAAHNTKLAIWLPAHPEFPGLLVALGFSACSSLLFSPFYNLLFGLQEAHLASMYQGLGRLIGTVAMVGLASLGLSLGWVFSGNVAGVFVTSLAAAMHCYRRHPWAFSGGRFWEPDQIRRQLRTGAKSLIMQMGGVLWGTAPVLAISSMAGAQAVPGYTIPMALLTAPFGMLINFCANLQAGYGEAMGRGDRKWIRETVSSFLRQSLLVTGLLGCGFMLLAEPFVSLWTGGRIDPSPTLLASVLSIAALGMLLNLFRYALTGINRHKRAAVSDLVCGVLAVALTFAAVKFLGAGGAGLGVSLAVMVTNGWMLPKELAHALGEVSVLPDRKFWFCWLLTIVVAACAGWLSWIASGAIHLSGWLQIAVTGAICGGGYLAFAFWLMPQDLKLFERVFISIYKKIPGVRPSAS